MKTYVYSFAPSQVPLEKFDKYLLGGKGAGLMEMCSLDLPVPPGCILTTELCRVYQQTKDYPTEVKQQLQQSIRHIEQAIGHSIGFGSLEFPLLLSVRSGAPFSMPGMMDTILNLGLNDETILGLIKQSQNPRFAWDCYRRFIQMYSEVVLWNDETTT